SATFFPRRVTRALPSTITKNSEPAPPSVTRTLPASTFTSSARRATSWRSFLDRAEKRGTSAKWSRNASRRSRATGGIYSRCQRRALCMTAAARGHIDGGLGQAGPRLRLVPELAGADGPEAAPRLRRWARRPPPRAAFIDHLGQERCRSGELTGGASSFLN